MCKNAHDDTIINSMPSQGFIKIPKTGTISISPQERVILVRKGNEFLNQKNYEQAKRIFLTIGYSAGLIRVGEYYEENGNIYEALKMYKSANATTKLSKISERIAKTLSLWIKE